MFSTRNKTRVAVVLALISAGLILSTHTRWNFVARMEQPVQASSAPPAYTLFEGGQVTFTSVPPGSGTRMGIDRDLDGVLNGDE